MQGQVAPLRLEYGTHGQTCHRSSYEICIDSGKFTKHRLYSGLPRTSQDTELLVDDRIWGHFPTEYGAVVHSDPLCARTIGRIPEWIETCDDDHDTCPNGESPKLPTRVLDVGVSEACQIVSLVETQGERGEYIALSHCWGKSNSFLTTRETFEDMKRGFQPEQAPATFRDAITVTRKLGIRYLWIDSLYIIQGDTRDWEIESSRMSGVY